EAVTVGCLASGFYPDDLTFTWKDASGKALTAVQYPPVLNNNRYMEVSLLQVQRADWDSLASFRCSVDHAGVPQNVTVIGLFMSALSSPCPEVINPPVVTLQPMPNGDTYSLICMIEDMPSKLSSVTWKRNGVEVAQQKTWEISPAGGSDSLISVLKVDKTEWESKSVYSCEVPHLGTTITKKTSSDTVAPVVFPLTQCNSGTGEAVTVGCLASGFYPDDLTFTWKDASGKALTAVQYPPVLNNNSDSVISVLKVDKTDWESKSVFSCEVAHLGRTITKKTSSGTVLLTLSHTHVSY
uniref:Ig-like domain-containing protein n=1 Tax=Myripristis murdjan TaxID=586833 RepID=A0A667X4W9_9TELE